VDVPLAIARLGGETVELAAYHFGEAVAYGEDDPAVSLRAFQLLLAASEAALPVDAMTTGAAVRTYNILLAENRRAGAGLIAVE